MTPANEGSRREGSRVFDAAIFGEYLTAIDRKLEIAHFHHAGLLPLLDTSRDDAAMPPVAIQAHFEGVLRATVAMSDQLIAGIAEAVSGMPEPYVAKPGIVLAQLERLEAAERVVELISNVRHDPLFLDVRGVRNQATHAYYNKDFDRHGWSVGRARYIPDGGEHWEGDRHLSSYSAALIDVAERTHAAAAAVMEDLA